MADDEWATFFADNLAPKNYENAEQDLEKFISRFSDRGIVLVTSGGTTVPLELNTVRYVDNFSAGTRGATSAEYFLRKDYAVIFMHRENSLQPFSRFLSGPSMLRWLRVAGDGQVLVSQQKNTFVRQIIEEFHKYSERLCEIQFTSLSDYLWLLRLASQLLNSHHKSILYLAAAVSDFYVPSQQLPEHKLQSSEGPPAIHLHIVPKMLKPLVSKWAPHCYVVSFKLETNPELVLNKGHQALEKYGHNLVVGNLLQTRKREVWILEKREVKRIELNEQELSSGLEIEKKIVDRVLEGANLFWR